MRRILPVLILSALLAAGVGPAAGADDGTVLLPFCDVLPELWYYDYVKDLYLAGILDEGDGAFDGEEPVSWGEAFRLILRTIGCEEPEAEEDGHWARAYIEPAVENRLVYSFDPADLDACPTRLQVAGMVARALDLVGIAGESPYADCGDGYAVQLYEKGIMDGEVDEDGVRWFRPDEPVTRAELAAILWRVRETDVTEGMFRYSNYWLDVLPDVVPMAYDPSLFAREGSAAVYAGGETALGVDVSGYQQDIDWEAVKADGIDFAVIRVGGRFIQSGQLYDDSWFERNMEGALAAGLEVGVYFFSQAVSEEEALEEADYVLERIRGYEITYPVVFDWEYLGGSAARTYGVEPDVISRCAMAFCRRVEEAGYTPMVYFNAYCGYIKFDLSMIDDYDFWYAQYSDAPEFRYHFRMWQYTNTGRVDGIRGDVDMNLCFTPYT